MTPFARDHGAAVEVALLVFLLRKHHCGEKEEAHHCLAAERPLDHGVHDEDDRDDREEDSVDVHVWQIVSRVIDPLLALPFPDVIVILCEPSGIFVRVVTAHSFGRQVNVSR